VTLEIFDVDQNSPEWLTLRAGWPTASVLQTVQAKVGPRGGVAKGRQTLLYKLAGERLTGEPMETYQNADMQRGHDREAQAAAEYAFLTDSDPQVVGFMRNGNCGASPDRLVGSEGLLEIKDAAPHIQIPRLLAGVVPPEHVAQCQGQLMVSERQWVDFISHCHGIAPLIVRVERDEEYIAALRIAVNEFCDELDALVQKIGSM